MTGHALRAVPRFTELLPGVSEQRVVQIAQPGGYAFAEAYPELGDIELEIYNSLVELRCAPFLLSYLQVRHAWCSRCGMSPNAA